MDSALGPIEFVLGLRSSGRKANVKWTEEKFFTNSLNLDFQQRLAIILRANFASSKNIKNSQFNSLLIY